MRPHDLPPAPGVTLTDRGAEVCVYAGHASAVWVCLFDADDTDGSSERRVELTEHMHGWWWTHLDGVRAGQRYGFRVDGPWEPWTGQRHNPAKLLLDPYAKAVAGGVDWSPAVYGHLVDEALSGDDEVRSGTDSAAHVPRAVVLDDRFDWGADERPRHRLTDSLIYEVHVRNATKLHPEVPERLRGTYAGLAHPAHIAHLRRLGVTAVELLPVHTFTSEPALARRGLANHWGYNTLGFFAPHAAYAAANDPQEVLQEFKGMVRLLHEAGIEVILDVVYNHTCEQGRDGATLSWRGLDNRAYYRLDDRGRDIDVTGCGNTLDLRHPVVCRMVLDSLRYWVTECHVDGFRFDLAVALGRGQGDDFDPNHPFLVALRTDPVLTQVKLIAEPWDVGIHGWRTGQFPPPFSEWNDRFRDGARTFWLSGPAAEAAGHPGPGVQDLATRLAGSQDLFGGRDRGPVASVNFVAAHDGFTVADLTAYDRKHNDANGEGNRDGTSDNRSFNHGVEGPTDDPAVLVARRRSMRNLLGTLLLGTGLPMLNAGDELGRSQGGNNNAYCQDSPVSWTDWALEPWQEDLLATTAHLSALRRELPALRRGRFLTGRPVQPGRRPDVAWFAADGQEMDALWFDPHVRTLQMFLDGDGVVPVHLVIHGGLSARTVTLPVIAEVGAYELLWDSTWERPQAPEQPLTPGPFGIGPTSMLLFRGVLATTG